MAPQPLVEYQYTLVPNGETLSSASDRRMERIVDTYDKKYAEKSTAKSALKRENRIDPYALRKYWHITRLDVVFANPPWNGWADLENKLFQLDSDIIYIDSKNLSGLQTYIITVTEGEEERIADEITDYYDLLNPIVKTGQITLCPEAPLNSLQDEFYK